MKNLTIELNLVHPTGRGFKFGVRYRATSYWTRELTIGWMRRITKKKRGVL